jgi:hypothetical protein
VSRSSFLLKRVEQLARLVEANCDVGGMVRPEARFIDGLRTGVEFTSNAGKLSHFAPSSKTGMTRCKMCSLNRRMSEHTGTLLYKSLIRRNL